MSTDHPTGSGPAARVRAGYLSAPDRVVLAALIEVVEACLRTETPIPEPVREVYRLAAFQLTARR